MDAAVTRASSRYGFGFPASATSRVNISSFVLAAKGFEAARFEIARGKRYRRFLRFPGGTMKKRERRGVIFICERHLGERKCRRPGKFAVGVIVEHFLQVGASIRVAMRGFDSIHRARSKRSPGPRAPDNRRDIFDIQGSPDRKVCERTSRWRNRADADRPLQLRAPAAPSPALLKSGELCRLSHQRGAGSARRMGGSSTGRARRTSGSD